MDADYTKITQHRVNAWVPEKDIKEQVKNKTIKNDNLSLDFPE